VAAHPDATLAHHCQLWQEAHARSLSVATMSRRLRGRGITLKKDADCRGTGCGGTRGLAADDRHRRSA
ncbi:MAG: hypothetical protein ACR2OE_02270, partial [Thermomicrobiales bacterium]